MIRHCGVNPSREFNKLRLDLAVFIDQISPTSPAHGTRHGSGLGEAAVPVINNAQVRCVAHTQTIDAAALYELREDFTGHSMGLGGLA
jgi:hypothetical protein